MTQGVTILGGGVAGLAMAAQLSARGAEVTVVDPAGPVGAHACSWWAGGMLAPECEGVLTESEVVRQGRKAASWWADMGADITSNGTLVVALGRDQSELKTFARRAEAATWLDRNGIAALEPDLADHVRSALFIGSEAHLDPRDTLVALHQRLAAGGVQFVTDRAQSDPGALIDCRGLAAQDSLTDLRGVKGEMLVVRSTDVTLNRPVRLLHPRFPLYIVPRADHVFMLGATQIESNERDRATLRSVTELTNAAFALHPAFAEAEILEIGVDARPAFPDNQPRIRQQAGRIHANGLFRHGFLLAPALATMTADYVIDGTVPEVWFETDS